MTDSAHVSGQAVTGAGEDAGAALVDGERALTAAPAAPTRPTSAPAAAAAVVLVNLGTPEEPTARAVRPYLREFLSDRRVIEMSPWMWRPILEGIILRVRPRASAQKYASIWMDEGSPLMHWTSRQRDGLTEILDGELGPGRVEVRVAMRYGSPALRDVLSDLCDHGTRRVLILPAYPQYAASSAGTVIDEAARWTLKARDQLELRTVRSFPDSAPYIEALAEALEEHWAGPEGRPDFEAGDKLVLSFHSIPAAMHRAGDPYRSECEITARLLGERLGLRVASCRGAGPGAEAGQAPSGTRDGGAPDVPHDPLADADEGDVLVRFQSVFGPSEWIGPATIDTMGALGGAGTRRVDVICPGFMADCLETLEEINILNRKTFLGAGGREFHYVPWANDSRGCVDTLAEQARRGLSGWVA
jgi:ferrochelatase